MYATIFCNVGIHIERLLQTHFLELWYTASVLYTMFQKEI